MAVKKRPISARLQKCCYAILVPALFIGFWQIIASAGFFLRTFLPAPLDVLQAVFELAQTGDLLRHASASLFRAFSGFLLASMIAIPSGLVLGFFKTAGDAFDGLIHIFRTISPIAWIPLAILWFGIGDLPAIFIIFITAVFPIIVATIHAVKHVDPLLLKVARNFGATNKQIILKVIVPSALPHIFVGLRIALGISWMVIVAAEMVGMRSGLGYMILDARNFLRTDMIIAGMIVIGLIGLLLDKLMSKAEMLISNNRDSLECTETQ